MISYAKISTVIIVWSCISLSIALSCESCGGECAAACGTRNFRTCCFNYLKKRGNSLPTGPQMRLELLMVLPELIEHYQPPMKQVSSILDANTKTVGSQSQLQLLFENLPKIRPFSII